MCAFFRKDRRYSELFSLYYPTVLNAVYGRVGVIEDAEDIVQNVFIRYYEKMDEVLDARAWLLGALRLEVMNHYQKKSGGDADIEDIFRDQSKAFTNGFRDSRIILEKAINGIREEESRMIFHMVAIQNYSFTETAETMGYSVRQIRYRYHNIVATILDDLRHQGIGSIEDLL
jgi:RNA polymerase sigma-70 factor (ECF subfamily)